MASIALRRAVVLLIGEALLRLESQLEGTMYRTPGHRQWLEDQRDELKRLLADLEPAGLGT